MPEMEALQGRRLVSKSINAKKARNGPSSANQGLSTSEPRHSHAVCTLQMPPSPIPPFCSCRS